MVLRFYARLPCYLWIFPRTDHLAVGACAPLAPGTIGSLKDSAHRLLSDVGSDPAGLPRYSALIPTLRPAALEANRVCGPGWSLVGDAAGTVDPLTREGIRHGVASADLLADSFAAGAPESYQKRWRAAFLPEFLWASARRERFFEPPVVERLVRYLARSAAIRAVMSDLVLGLQDYAGLKRRLIRTAPRLVIDLALAGL